MIAHLPTSEMWGLPITIVAQPRVYQKLLGILTNHSFTKTYLVATPNPEQIILAQKNQAFKHYLQQMDLLIPDGEGLIWASKHRFQRGWQTDFISQRITGADTADFLLRTARENQQKVLIIGGFYHDLVNEQFDIANTNKVGFEQKIQLNNQTSAYWSLGYKNISKPTTEEKQRLDQLITHLQPELVLVAFGAPYQEKWLIENKKLLNQNQVKLAMAVGGAIDFLTDKRKRAPQKWQQMRLEWLWRLFQEPKRWKRQLALLSFIKLACQKPASLPQKSPRERERVDF